MDEDLEFDELARREFPEHYEPSAAEVAVRACALIVVVATCLAWCAALGVGVVWLVQRFA